MHDNCILWTGNPYFLKSVERTLKLHGKRKRRDVVRGCLEQRIWELELELSKMKHLRSLISNVETNFCPQCQKDTRHQIIWGDAVCHSCGRISEKLVGLRGRKGRRISWVLWISWVLRRAFGY